MCRETQQQQGGTATMMGTGQLSPHSPIFYAPESSQQYYYQQQMTPQHPCQLPVNVQFPPAHGTGDGFKGNPPKQQHDGGGASLGKNTTGFSNVTGREAVMMTLIAVVNTKNGPVRVRVFIDPGSEESYVDMGFAESAGLQKVSQKRMKHQVFGGLVTKSQEHDQYQITVCSLDGRRCGSFLFNAVPRIAQGIEKPPDGNWINELSQRGIQLSDQREFGNEVHLLIGMDIEAQVLTGAFHRFDPYFYAKQTIFGWVEGGTLPEPEMQGRPFKRTISHMVTSMMLGSLKEEDLWSLETLGITDEARTQTRKDLEEAALVHFQDNVTRQNDGRYEVALPWIEGHQLLLSNRNQAVARLRLLTQQLKREGYLQDYNDVIRTWENDGVVERVPAGQEKSLEYFLPHRHVIKENSTTPVRPVFDASSKVKGSPSLNECLEKGPNLLELIPAVMSRFRFHKFGVIADIRKAFLQIAVRRVDRDVLQFLWYGDDSCSNIQVFRHTRVVFGVTTSPFLLGAIINHHLKKPSPGNEEVAEQLLRSFYVDNSVSSHATLEEAGNFKEKSVELLSSAQMDLRGWEIGPSAEAKVVPVLGMIWNTGQDVLYLSLEGTMKKIEQGGMTKKGLLSIMNSVFDPMGFMQPFTILPKFLFQKCCELGLNWDEKLPVEIAQEFEKWKVQVPVLGKMKIPRWMCKGAENGELTLHVFSDASCTAFSSCIFLRSEAANGSSIVQLVMCRSRVAPAKRKVTIPRLELLGCLIGVRLAAEVKGYLGLPEVKCYYWTDSSTALAWITNEKQWARFVQNCVEEIRKGSEIGDWRHVPGELNPADLPSRGCSAEQLLQLQWWEGPTWLKKPESEWPRSSFAVKEEEVMAEAKKTVVSCNAQPNTGFLDRLEKFSSYNTILRIVSVVLRYISCLKERASARKNGNESELQLQLVGVQVPDTSVDEINIAETTVWRYVQQRNFSGVADKKLKNLSVFLDEKGLIRTRTQLFYGCDKLEMRCPIVLPSKDLFVTALILAVHESHSHVGVQILLALLRERFWILDGRRRVSSVIGTCLKCRRFNARKCIVPGAPLPRDRIANEKAFAVTGVNLLGPLFLFNGEKVWVVLYTCAVYRCVHLEITKTLSTPGFVWTFRRFVARRGRPTKVYSDNGLNFVGCSNLFDDLDWNEVSRYAKVKRIEWIFNPPTAAWWGGWWERLVGLTKNLLRRVLGNRVVAYEELYTIMCEVEESLNQRPLTYLSEKDDLVPLCPALFLRDNGNSGLPEVDVADAKVLRKSAGRIQHLREQLRSRIRKEYLGQLRHVAGTRNVTVKVGDVVLIEHEDKKRIDWPWGVVKEVYPGRDGKVRAALVKTVDGQYLRPVQRLFLMEAALSPENELDDAERAVNGEKPVAEATATAEDPVQKESTTRAGRKIKKPVKFGY